MQFELFSVSFDYIMVNFFYYNEYISEMGNIQIYA